MRSISARSSAVSTTSTARTFSSSCLRDFAPGIRYDEGPQTGALCHWPRDGELGECGVLPVGDRFKRRAQPEVVLEIGAVESRQLRANVVCFHFLNLKRLGAQHPAPEHGIGHHRDGKLLASVDLTLFFRITRKQRVLHLKR